MIRFTVLNLSSCSRRGNEAERRIVLPKESASLLRQYRHRAPRLDWLVAWLFAASLFASLLPSSTNAQSNPAGQPKRQDKPNLIFILADDLGYGDVGCYGQEKIKTPSLDRMAEEGMRFTSVYAGSTVCAPSRCALMTGLHTGHCWIRGNSSLALRPEDVTVGEALQRAGYRTGLFGKWGLGLEDSTGVPGKKGFDEWFGYLDQQHAHN